MKIPLYTLFFFMPLLTMLSCINTGLVSGQCRKDQQSLLLQLKNTLVFDQSLSAKLVKWNSTSDCCEWPGITCDEGSGRVISLDLSSESITGGLDDSSALFSLQFLQSLNLAFNSFDTALPVGFANLTDLISLNLSRAGFTGQIPNDFSKLTKLVSLDLSAIFFLGGPPLKLEKPNFATLVQNLTHLTELLLDGVNISAHGNDWCKALSSSLPNLRVLSMSNCYLSGPLDASLAKLQSLSIIRLSGNNFLSGTIPSCLIERIETLRVLNLRRNNFDGIIPDKFPRSCELKTLDLSGNNLQGQVPKSLANCTVLEVLDLGNNQINDSFPCLLKSISSFRVLVLRNNMFSRFIGCPQIKGTWPRLQIVDLAFNHFRGNLPNICLKTWEGMMEGGNRNLEHIRYDPVKLTNGLYYQDSITVTFKGLELELVKILTVFTSADFSSNNFEGPIPDAIGQFAGLHVFNLSHNALTGQIPSSLGNLSQLESLDLSSNQLSGQIPPQLVSLTFLSVLNLSYNRIGGRIPTGNQFGTFSSDSFEGNQGLCGFPLNPCSNPLISAGYNTNGSNSGIEIDWNFLSVEFGYIFGLGIVILPLMFCKRWRTWYYTHVNRKKEARILAEELKETEEGSNIGGEDQCAWSSIIRPMDFASLNLSFNIFDTALPVGFAHLTDLISLNLSNAGFTGQIPSSLGSLSELESLDLSSNQLSGQIPPQLVSLTFLAVLNLSYNRLVGRIPTGNQFNTFSSDSFEGNQGLCGFPLSLACSNTKGSNSGIEIEWNFLSVEFGYIFGLGIVIQPLMFCKRWRTWYYKHVDRIKEARILAEELKETEEGSNIGGEDQYACVDS
ncbi:hypothetical protein NC651_035799 [Populus alba x Populus x berolinensis]|nr:hypothetical protein NC651_035799 [Populus alba x Populus x berolinensis]